MEKSKFPKIWTNSKVFEIIEQGEDVLKYVDRRRPASSKKTNKSFVNPKISSTCVDKNQVIFKKYPNPPQLSDNSKKYTSALSSPKTRRLNYERVTKEKKIKQRLEKESQPAPVVKIPGKHALKNKRHKANKMVKKMFHQQQKQREEFETKIKERIEKEIKSKTKNSDPDPPFIGPLPYPLWPCKGLGLSKSDQADLKGINADFNPILLLPIPRLEGSVAKWKDRKKGITNTKNPSKKHERSNYMELQYQGDQKRLAKFRRLIERAKESQGSLKIYERYGRGIGLPQDFVLSKSLKPIEPIKETPQKIMELEKNITK